MLKNFIVINDEGMTFQPNSDMNEPDIENCLVVGFCSGYTVDETYNNLIKNYSYLLDTIFNKLIFYELQNNYEETSCVRYLDNKSQNGK